MLTRKTYKCLGTHFTITSLLCGLPFVWDRETERVACTTSKIRLFIWFFNMFTSLGPTIRLIQCFIHGSLTGDRPIAALALDMLYIIPYTMQIFFQWSTIFHKEEVASLMNSVLSIDKKFTEIYNIPPTDAEAIDVGLNGEEMTEEADKATVKKKKKSKDKEETDGCDDNIAASTFMMFVYSAMSVSLFMKNPMSPRYLYSQILGCLNLAQDNLWLFYVWAFVEYFTLVKFCMMFNNVFYMILLYAHSTNYWFKSLSRPDTDKGEKIEGIKTPETLTEILMIYKAQMVLNMHFNECCAHIFLPAFKILNILLHTLAIYVTITFWNVIPISGFLIFPIGVVMWCTIEADVYPLLGRTNGLSISYRESWEVSIRTNFSGRRNFAQLFPLGVKVSNAYTINKTTVLSLWAIIFNMVINCIVL